MLIRIIRMIKQFVNKFVSSHIMEYYSQFGQDKFLDQKIFKGKNSGFFLEIGADDGVRYSNTYFFEKFRGWQGICIERGKNLLTSL